MKRYIGFYTSHPFWAGKGLQHSDYNQKNTQENFTSILEDVIFKDTSDDYSIKICRDGMFLLRINSIFNEIDKSYDENNPDNLNPVELWPQCLNYVNSFLLLFYSSFFKINTMSYHSFDEISTKDAFIVDLEEDKNIGMNICINSYAGFLQNGRHFSNYNCKDSKILSDPRIIFRQEITEDVFKDLFFNFNKLLYSNYDLSLFSQINKSLSEYKILNFNTSFVLSWFIIEIFINDKWKIFLDKKNVANANVKRLNRKRKQTLEEGINYTTSVKSNFLELSDELPLDFFTKFDTSRKVRNRIVHDGYKSNAQDCIQVFDLIKYIIEEEVNIKIIIDYYSIRTSGI